MSATGTVARHRGAFRRLLAVEARLAWREPVALVWGVGLPVVLVLIFGNISAFREVLPGSGGLTVLDAYLPVLVMVVLAMLGLVGLPVPLATYRELGVLRRMSTTPVHPSWVLGAQLVVNLAMAAVAVALVLGMGMALGAQLPSQALGFALALVLATATLFTLGLCVAAMARTARAAAALGNALFFPLAFFGGLWLPQPVMPEVLQRISGYTPTGAAVQAMTSTVQGSFPSLASLLVMGGYAVAFAVVAVRTFRWE